MVKIELGLGSYIFGLGLGLGISQLSLPIPSRLLFVTLGSLAYFGFQTLLHRNDKEEEF